MPGTAVRTKEMNQNVVMHQIVFTADASNASVPDYVFNSADMKYLKDYGYFLYQAVYIPGAPAMSNNVTDIVVKDSFDRDLMGGGLLDLVNTAPTLKALSVEVPAPTPDSLESVPQPIVFDLTVSVSGNAINSGVATLQLFFANNKSTGI